MNSKKKLTLSETQLLVAHPTEPVHLRKKVGALAAISCVFMVKMKKKWELYQLYLLYFNIFLLYCNQNNSAIGEEQHQKKAQKSKTQNEHYHSAVFNEWIPCAYGFMCLGFIRKQRRILASRKKRRISTFSAQYSSSLPQPFVQISYVYHRPY